MEHFFTPDEWPRIRERLNTLAIKYEHLRYDLNKPHLGWRPVTVGARRTVEGAISAQSSEAVEPSAPREEQASLL